MGNWNKRGGWEISVIMKAMDGFSKSFQLQTKMKNTMFVRYLMLYDRPIYAKIVNGVWSTDVLG